MRNYSCLTSDLNARSILAMHYNNKHAIRIANGIAPLVALRWCHSTTSALLLDQEAPVHQYTAYTLYGSRP